MRAFLAIAVLFAAYGCLDGEPETAQTEQALPIVACSDCQRCWTDPWPPPFGTPVCQVDPTCCRCTPRWSCELAPVDAGVP